MIRAVLFDWGGTLMRELPFAGPMKDWPRVEALPHAAATLARLHARGSRLALASNAEDSGAADIRAALARAGLAAFIERVFCARELGARKPEPAFFAACLDGLGLAADQVVMVGDGWETDVLGAVRAGLHAVWLSPRPAPRPLPVIRDLAELPALLERLGATPPVAHATRSG